MTDKQLLKTCTQFRYGVIGRSSSKDKCYIVAAPLCAFLKFGRVQCELIEGFITLDGDSFTNHYWILLGDGRIIDPTADQFNKIKEKEMPKVYIGEKPYWYMERKMKKSQLKRA